MRQRLLISVLVGLLLPIVLTPTTAQANGNCKPDRLSSDYFGKKFRCSDGSTLTVKPNLGGSYTDPWSTYKAKDSYGNNFRCKYSDWRQRYDCK